MKKMYWLIIPAIPAAIVSLNALLAQSGGAKALARLTYTMLI